MDEWLNSSDEIEVTDDDGSILKVPDLGAKSRHIVFAHSLRKPLTVNLPCFEVKIVHQAKDSCLGLGICKECFLDADAMRDDEHEESAADKRPDAVAYFSDDGTVSSTAKEVGKDHLPTYGQGDTITFYVDYQMAEKSLIGILKNGQLICRRWITLSPEFVLPTLNVWWGPAELRVKWQSELTYSPSAGDLEHWRVPDTVTIKDNIFLMRNSHKTTTVQSPVCFSDDYRYYEAKLTSMGENGGKGPVIGLSSATYKQSEHPGTSYESVGFVASEGLVYQDKRINGAKKDAQPCLEGDTVGCGILYVEAAGTCRRKAQKVVVFYTKNNEVIKHGVFNQSPGGFYPSIGLQSSGCSVEVSTSCSMPSLPDSEAWLKKANSPFGDILLGFDPPKRTGAKHEDGIKEGCYRFSDMIGPPKDDIITPKKKIEEGGKMLQYLSPLTPEMPLFTLEIIDGDDSGVVCIGVSRNEQSVGSMPGSLVDSVGYSSSGRILMEANSDVEAASYKQGDIVGCYIEYFDSAKCVQFIKNGQLVGTVQVKGSDTDLYPSVGFSGNPSTVRLTWQHTKPQLPPVYSQENLSSWLCSTGLKLTGNTLSVAKKNRKLKGLWFASPQPLSKEWSYFEVTVQNELLPTNTQIVPKAPWIGFTNDLAHLSFKKLRKKPDARMVSYLCNSNGVAYVNAMKQNIDFQLENIKKGDRLGFGVWYPEDVSQSEARKQQAVVAYVCLNDNCFWWQAFDQLSGGLYPFIALYRYGDVVSISHQCPPRNATVSKAWQIEVENLKEKLHQQRKLGQKETASTRRHRPASPVERKESILNRYKVYIHCDITRYNEATYIQARLHSKGFTTSLSNKSSLNSPLLEPSIQDHGCIVVCIGPEGAGSARIQNAIEEAREKNLPVIPLVLESMQWPPPGPLEKELSLLTMDRLEMQTDFYWGCDQIGEYTQRLDGKGYNGKTVTVNTGKGATQLYTDAQKGKQTTNEKSDPNALKMAVEDADKKKQMKGFGSDDRPASSQEISQQEKAEVPERPKSDGRGGRSKSAQKSSKTCIIL